MIGPVWLIGQKVDFVGKVEVGERDVHKMKPGADVCNCSKFLYW